MYSDYIKLIKRNPTPYVQIELLNPDETVRKEITNEIWDIQGMINLNKNDGARRTCSITIDASGPDFPLNPSDFWFETKFKVWMGIIIRGEPYVFPQGVYCLTNPNKVYNPGSKTITLQGTDKWCRIDGTMGGVLNKTFKTMFNQDLKQASADILGFSRYLPIENKPDYVPERDRIDPKPIIFEDWDDEDMNTEAIQYTTDGDVIYGDTSVEGLYVNNEFVQINEKNKSKFKLYVLDNNNQYHSVILGKTTDGKWDGKYITGEIAGTQPESSKLVVFMQSIPRTSCPYTSTIEAGKTFADILKEYAKMMMANVYYNADGYLVFKPYSRSVNEASDFNRDFKWHFTIAEREMTALSLTYNFQNVYNDLIVLGNISNGYQAQGRLQNRNPASPFSIDKIGLKTKQPYSDTKYYSDRQCRELGAYYAQIEMEMEKSGSITSTPLYHLDVGDIVTITTEQDEKNEPYLVTGLNLPLSPTATMSITITNMRYFTNWTAVDEKNNPIDIVTGKVINEKKENENE